MHPKLRAELSKFKFSLGLNPKIEKRSDYRLFIPEPWDAVIIFQADFELAWAWRFSKNQTDVLRYAEDAGLIERENIPLIVDLCDKFNVPVTWATVGHLFLESCSREHNIPHPEIKRLRNFENKYWKFDSNDWFDSDPCSDFRKSPAWYCPDLIELILNSKVKHEVACHTFSHIDCSDEICPPEVLESELNACKLIAESHNITLRSFVHPAHTIGNLQTIKNFGYTNFRTNYINTLGYPVFHPIGIWELKSTMDLIWRDYMSVKDHIFRYNRIIDRAIKNKSVCVLWFHPSVERKFLNEVLPEIFRYLDYNRDKIKIMTSGTYFDFLNKSVNFG